MKTKNSFDAEVELSITKKNPFPGFVDYYLSYNGVVYPRKLNSAEQIAWTIDNRPEDFIAWLDGLDLSTDDDCLCSQEAYDKAIAMGKKTGRMSDYVRVDADGKPLPRSMQC